jgi:glycyl-tRNA synthetase
VTVDRDGVETAGTETVTVRERDSAAQIRVPVDDLVETLRSLHAGESFAAVASRHESVETDVETA